MIAKPQHRVDDGYSLAAASVARRERSRKAPGRRQLFHDAGSKRLCGRPESFRDGAAATLPRITIL